LKRLEHSDASSGDAALPSSAATSSATLLRQDNFFYNFESDFNYLN
jgi:hypothetical protein